ncbi:MAG: chemotaxis protein CheA, partial [Clostridiales bacterium]|nr:chemotaxis protein CheA [Clostridiales bacterium]
MGSGNEILDMYIYETNTLLEQLETIILEAEKVDTFSQENVNEIFRVMHTIKGSSAMMEFDTLARVAHRIEDMFFLIREGTMSVVPDEERPALFDVVFQSIDYFRGEVEKVEAGEPLDKDIDSFLSNINTLIAKIKGEDVPAEAAAPAPASAPAPQAAAPSPAAPAAAAGGFPCALRVNFEEGCGMESLRAFMVVTAVRDVVSDEDFI